MRKDFARLQISLFLNSGWYQDFTNDVKFIWPLRDYQLNYQLKKFLSSPVLRVPSPVLNTITLKKNPDKTQYVISLNMYKKKFLLLVSGLVCRKKPTLFC